MNPNLNSYDYDIFISYRRHEGWPGWVKTHFIPILRHWLGEEIGRDVRIFLDEYNLESGNSWPIDLGSALSKSAVMIPLLSRQYFNSDWCRKEISVMLAREQELGLRTPNKPSGLIVPAVIHDGRDFPPIVKVMQSKILRDYANPFMAAASPKREVLGDEIKLWSKDIKNRLEGTPARDPGWLNIVSEEFEKLFRDRNQPAENFELPML